MKNKIAVLAVNEFRPDWRGFEPLFVRHYRWGPHFAHSIGLQSAAST